MSEINFNKDTIKSFYDNRYNGVYMQDHKGLDIYRVKSLLNEIPNTVKMILDYGCGQGRWIKILSRAFPDGKISGTDVSSRAIELAVEKYPQYKFFPFDGETTPFADDSFDLIFSYHVLEHVCDIEKTIFDISRLLKKGGYLCTILPCGNKNSFEERITHLVQGGKEDSIDARERFFYEDPGHIRRMKSRELIELFSQNNVRLYKEFYAYQFWGAIEWISKSGYVLINKIFSNNKGVNLLAKMKLLFFRIIFIILAIPMRLYTADLLRQIKSNRNMAKKMLLLPLIPFKVIAIPFGKIIDLLSFLEWRFFKTRKNGSAQYLIFKK